jgi:hypothetical protein
VVENPPHATHSGEDAKLDTVIRMLLKKLNAEPVPPLRSDEPIGLRAVVRA